MPENEPAKEPDREFVYPIIILPRLIEDHDVFIEGLTGIFNEE
jgi:hypothetical protein